LFQRMALGALGANCYIIGDEKSRRGVVVDPGGDAPRIMEVVSAHRLDVEYIILTHGHVDHIAAVGEVKSKTGAQVGIHQLDAEMLTRADRNLSSFAGGPVAFDEADIMLRDGQVIELDTLSIRVIHTPGHTPGGICLLVEGPGVGKGEEEALGHSRLLLTGDTLFAGSIGRTDFPGGSYQELISSIKTRVMVLDGEIPVFPGHGPDTTVVDEREHNPFFQ